MSKKVKFALFAAIAACEVVLLFWLATLLHVKRNKYEKPPSLVGNSQQSRQKVRPYLPGKAFSVGACGDLRSDETFDRLAAELRKADLAFLVLLGDLARDPEPEEHSFLRYKMHKTWRFPFPVFLLPGNHDVDPRSYSIERFERVYGPVRFSLVRGPLRFIFLDILPKRQSNEEALLFLENELRRAKKEKQRCFVFGHGSPHVSKHVGGRKFAGEDRLVELLLKYQAEYYIGGDFHGYCRTKKGSTVFISTGGGGANLAYKNGFGFHHAFLLRIGSDKVVEQLCVVPKKVSPIHYAVYWAVMAEAHLGELSWLLPVAVCLLLAFFALKVVGKSYRKST